MSLGTTRLQETMKYAQLVVALNNNFSLLENIDKDTFKIVDVGEVTMSVPSVSQGNQATITATALHSLGIVPEVFAFVTYPDVQSVDSAFTRLFGGSSVSVRSVNSSEVTIGSVETQTVGASKSQVNFSWVIANSNPISTPAYVAKVRYYLMVNKTL